jgi:hypothetical protein
MKSQYEMKRAKLKQAQEELEYVTLVQYLNNVAAMERAYERNPNHPTIDQTRINAAVRRFHNWRDMVCCDRVREEFRKRHS